MVVLIQKNIHVVDRVVEKVLAVELNKHQSYYFGNYSNYYEGEKVITIVNNENPEWKTEEDRYKYPEYSDYQLVLELTGFENVYDALKEELKDAMIEVTPTEKYWTRP